MHFKTKLVEKSQFSFKKLNQLPLYRSLQIILSVFPSSSDASTHFHIEIPSIFFIYIHQQKYRKGHAFSNPRTFLIKHLICYIFYECPVSLKLLLNILYPNNVFLKYPSIPVIFFREYPVSRKPLMGLFHLPLKFVH